MGNAQKFNRRLVKMLDVIANAVRSAIRATLAAVRAAPWSLVAVGLVLLALVES